MKISPHQNFVLYGTQNDCLRHEDQDQPLSLLTQSFHSMDRYCIATEKPVNRTL